MKNNIPYEIVSINDIPVLYTKIMSLDSGSIKCPKCNTELQKSFTYIPIGLSKCIKVPATHCINCHTDFVSGKNEEWVKRFLKTDVNAKRFTFNGRHLNGEHKRQKREHKKTVQDRRIKEKINKLQAIGGAAVMIDILENELLKEVAITSDKTTEAPCKNIYHYTSDYAREVLAAAYRPEKHKTGEYRGKEFVVKGGVCRSLEKIKTDLTTPEFIIDYITLGKGGGYYSQQKKAQSEIVDILLYSPFTRRYEVIRGTKDEESGEIYTDTSLFRNFVKKYGNPGVYVAAKSGFVSDKLDFDGFAEESILRQYGYTVSQAEGLSSETRQEILAEIVDLEILSVYQIVSMLDMFILTHKGPQYEFSRYKWETDKKFIQNYKVNPNRFLIANQVL